MALLQKCCLQVSFHWKMANQDVFNIILANIEQNSEIVGRMGCRKWQRANIARPSGLKYGQVRFKLPTDAKSKVYYVHRLEKMSHIHVLNIPPNVQASHLCHFSLCLNPSHISLEPAAINNQRQQCGDLCTGHKLDGITFPECILR